MKLPNLEVVPDWLVLMVAVAPDEWPECTDSAAAAQRLTELQKALTNPDVLYCLSRLCITALETSADVTDHDIHGMSDIFTHHQVIGEHRGLRRLLRDLDEARTKLQQAIK